MRLLNNQIGPIVPECDALSIEEFVLKHGHMQSGPIIDAGANNERRTPSINSETPYLGLTSKQRSCLKVFDSRQSSQYITKKTDYMTDDKTSFKDSVEIMEEGPSQVSKVFSRSTISDDCKTI